MKLVSYILLGVALLLAIIGLVLLLKLDREKRNAVLESLEKARDMKAVKKAEKGSNGLSDEKEFHHPELKNEDHASKKEKTE